MYALLIGRPPFAEGDVAQKLARHASEPAVTLDQFGMPPAIVAIGRPHDGQESAGATG